LFGRWPIRYLPTHCDGGALAKMMTALRALATLVGLLLRPGGAIVHVHGASRASFWRKSVFMSIAMLARCPVIFHLHGGGFERFYRDECGPVARRYVRFFLDRAAAVVVLSGQWSAWMKTITSNPRVHCVSNPVAGQFVWHPPRRRHVVLFVGRLERAKGIMELLDAVAALRSSIPDIELVCAGDGDMAGVAEHAARLGIADAVKLTGWVGAERKKSLLMEASAFVLPSHAEGLPMSLLEAMTAGVPVIASSVGGIPDVVADGVNGFLVPPGDTTALTCLLRRLMIDSALGRRLGCAARESTALRFHPDRVIGSLEKIYASLGLERSAASQARAPSERDCGAA
jgi:glycosyltransferase involved in cell wall biosynthesis